MACFILVMWFGGLGVCGKGALVAYTVCFVVVFLGLKSFGLSDILKV